MDKLTEIKLKADAICDQIDPINEPEYCLMWENVFAELLIRECASLAYDGYHGILDHFGVKDEV